MNTILLDIEGTTTPIEFVHDTLFPFAKTRIAKFVETHFGDLGAEINLLSKESSADTTYTIPFDPTEPGSISSYLEHLMDGDRKSTPLKSIQGKIWREGYESGDLMSVVFDDVRPAFERWMAAGKPIAIFSSGSVLAQQLLFRHTDHGDLTAFISHYFDTHIGPKRDANSYVAIAEALDSEAEKTLFISDIVAELEAARESGLMTALAVRPGNAPADAGNHQVIRTFDSLE